jgi:iron-sulfur cluster assembly protein
MIQVSDTAKKKIDLMSEDGFDTDYVRVGVKVADVLVCLIKFDKAKSEDDKIFIDNEITIAVEKNLSYI